MSNGELNIPDSWAETVLENTGIWGSGGTPLKGKSEYYGGDINWCKTGDLNDGYVNDIPDKITEKGFEAIPSKLYPIDTIIMAMYGATIGRLGILTVPASVNQACACCETYKQIKNKYLFYWLMNQRKNFISLGQGGAQPNISRKIIYEQPFGLPPQKEQNRIVDKIESCFSKIEKTESALKEAEILLTKYRESLLAKAFRGELIEQDPNDEPASELLKRIRAEQEHSNTGKKKKDELPHISEDEIPFEIPESWEWVKLGNILSVRSGKNLTANEQQGGTIPVYGGNGITGYHNEANLFESVVIIGRVGAKCGVVHITEENSWVTDNALIVTCSKSNIDKQWLANTLELINLNSLSNSSAQPVISGEKIYSVLVPLPPLNEQNKIAKLINDQEKSLAYLLKIIEKKLQVLKKLKESILNNAFQGKLVPQIPEEGTGHELLEQILKEKELEAETQKKSKKKVATKTTTKKKK